MTPDSISTLVDEVMERSPFPATLAESDPYTRRRLIRTASEQGVDAEELYAGLVANEKATRADLAEARALAIALRR